MPVELQSLNFRSKPFWLSVAQLRIRQTLLFRLTGLILLSLIAIPVPGQEDSDQATLMRIQDSILPLLQERCFDCHGDGAEEGGVNFDHLAEQKSDSIHPLQIGDPQLWQRVLKQIRSGLMPPPDDAERLEEKQLGTLQAWILDDVFQYDASNPDPGRVTVRRLNRVEYRNSIRDLLGVDFNTSEYFPADDAGEGFDNLADVLTISPLLMEKYINAAQTVVGKIVPKESKRTPRRELKNTDSTVDESKRLRSGIEFPFYKSATAGLTFEIDTDQEFALEFDLVLAEDYIEDAVDSNRCRIKVFLDDELLINEIYGRDPWKKIPFSFPRQLKAGQHEIRLELKPTTTDKPGRKLRIKVEDLSLAGPLAAEFQIVPTEYSAFFARPIPESESERLQYASELLRPFAKRAFRRSVDDATIERLTKMAQHVWQSPTGNFESGIEQAMVAVLSSPRFLFREEFPLLAESTNEHPLIDEYSLAARLSYFLWSTMPDQELLNLAGENKLRENLDEQLGRMKKDSRFDSFYQNFVGQWLRTRDVEGVAINSLSVLLRESEDSDSQKKLARFRELREIKRSKLTSEQESEIDSLLTSLRPIFDLSRETDLTPQLRRSMRLETERMFEYVMETDRDLTELISGDYSFLDEKLANHYGIPGIKGDKFRKVTMPADSLRGGILGHGSMLTVTSNPDRTSPVKRGLFLLENILGMPTGAPPANIPPLEESETDESGDRLSLVEALAVHRENALCSSCHNRMDPLGLALENFDPLGRLRVDQSIDVSGRLISGEAFANLTELKQILATNHRAEIYRCVTEKMLTFALGRSLEYYDVPTVDKIVDRLLANGGKGSDLLRGVVDSAPFQKTRNDEVDTAVENR